MKKLKLEDLQVTTFETVTSARERGTVVGHGDYSYDFCSHDGGASVCNPANSYDGTCQSYNTRPCDWSGNASCPNYTCEGATCGRLIC